jgi:DNA invertase Pin-like site-specific DNA recombinase
MTKCVAYCRVSGQGQIVGHGFERQIDSIKCFCKKSSYQLAKIYKEQVSGIKDETERPEFSTMVSDILSNGCNIIIVESLDRLAREYRIQEQLLIYLASKNIDLIAANTEENVTQAIYEDPMRKAMIQIQGIFAELDKSLTVKKLRKSREKIRKETGRCEGVKPYGSTPDEAEILKKIRYMRRRSRYQTKPLSYRAIAEKLNDERIKTRHGKKWTANLVFNVLKKKA